jgi:NodT family efflux transporter outer membrane factor (OMF) lipoprotein
MTRVVRHGVLLALLLAGGCSLAPPYQAPTLPAPQAFKEQGPWVDAAPADTLPASAWWSLYGDATLDALETRLDAANPDIAVAADRYAQASAYFDQARSGLFPTFGASGQMTHNRQSNTRPLRSASQPDEYRDDAIGAQLGYELDLWGRVRNLVAAGRAAAQASADDLAGVKLSLEAQLAADYIALRGVEAEEKLLSDTVDAYTRARDLIRTRFNGGIATGLDVARADTQLSSARAQLSDVRARRALLEHALAALSGTTPAAFKLDASTTDLPLPKIPLTLPSTLLQRRPDVAAAERRASAANANIGVARAAFFPDIVLGAVGGYESTGSNGWLTAPNSFWSLGPHFTLPIFDAGKRRAIERQARAAFDESADRYRSTALGAFREVEDQLALLHWLGDEYEDQNAAVASARKALDLALDRYKNGAVNYLDVVEAQVTALAAQRTALALRDRQLNASVQLVKALGGGWSEAPADVALAPAPRSAAAEPAR